MAKVVCPMHRTMRVLKWGWRVFALLAILFAGPVLVACTGKIQLGQDWRTADRSSAGIAPLPGSHEQAIVLVYSARAFNWRGMFGVHTWIATKRHGADIYMVHQVVGWRARQGLPVVVSEADHPDRLWYGSKPELLADIRGNQAAALIPRIEQAVARYPYRDHYTLWPGPNSNTFTAFVTRHTDQFAVDLPPTAIGKDFLGEDGWLARTPSGSGFQLSIFGLLGILASWDEGVEINLFGLVFGIDPLAPALKLPGLGRIGAD